jgi:hypothetical protein
MRTCSKNKSTHSERIRALGLGVLGIPLEDLDDISLKFHFQKNGQHGETRLLSCNPDPNDICAITAACRSPNNSNAV